MENSLLRKLTFALLTVGGILLSGSEVQAQQLLNPATQPRFVNQLTAPSVIDVTNGFTQPLKMEIKQFQKDLGLIDPTTGQPFGQITKVWGYRQVDLTNPKMPEYPGPTIVAASGTSLDVYWLNELRENGTPLPHLLNVDNSIHTAYTYMQNQSGVPVVTHLHGGYTESASDGLPDAWFTPGFADKGPGFRKGDPDAVPNLDKPNIDQPYHYSNDQRAATIWYHDHALGVTRLNVYAGLAGFYLITDGIEAQLKEDGHLPAAPYDLGLAIQDRLFTADGQLHFPTAPVPDPEGPGNVTDFGILPEMFGNTILVNGQAWPYLEVEPRQYRFRLLNGSDSRFYNLFFSEPIKFWQIASDQGLLPAPVGSDQLLLANGERKEVVIDFSNPALWGKTIILRNNAKAPYPKGATPNPQNEGQIMAFKVVKPLNNAYPLTPLPASFNGVSITTPTPDQPARKLILFEGMDEYDRMKPMLGTFEDGALNYHDDITEIITPGATEIWEIYNLTEDAHPIHLHQVHFQVLNTQKFKPQYDKTKPENEAMGIMSSAQLLGQPKLPEMGQRGLKDTYPINPGEVARFIATFNLEGEYVWHCHILSHEDHDMMRKFYVGEMNGGMLAAHRTSPEGIAASLDASEKNSYKLFPNPFAGFTELHYKTTEAGNVTVRVYDLKGRLVKEVFSGHVAPGQHQQQISAQEMSSGLYICEIQLNGKTHRERLVVAK